MINLADIDINRGDNIYISSELLGVLYSFHKKGEKFDPNIFLNDIIDYIGEEGTVIIPTYTFSFSNYGIYDYCKTKSEVGYLGNVALQRHDFQRTLHPMHNMAVYGKNKELLCGLKNTNSFGEDSPFAWMIEHNTKEVGIGLSFEKATTYFHYIENMAQVPYRYNKVFKGEYIDKNGDRSIREYDYPARRLDIGYTKKKEGFKKILIDSDSYIEYCIDGIDAYVIDMNKSYLALYEEYTVGRCAKTIDFTVDRDALYEQRV